MSPIYKVYHISNDSVLNVYAFVGGEFGRSDDKIRSLDADAPELRDIFPRQEIDALSKAGVTVSVVPFRIYADDTIDTIKRKVLMAMDNGIAYPEIYMFTKAVKTLNPVTVFQNLTQNGRIELTRLRLVQFLSNIEYSDVEKIESKEVYDYDDILALNLTEHAWNVSVPLGQRFVAIEGTFPYTVNPFSVIQFDPMLSASINDMVTTTSSELLLSGPEPVENVIFMCAAKDVLSVMIDNQLSEETCTRIYFPFLSNQNILNLSELESAKKTLDKASKAMITTNFKKQQRSVEMMADVYAKRLPNVYSNNYQGTDKIEVVLHPVYSFRLPLDIVFRLLHASKDVQFIKYTPGHSQEKMYRLYAPSTAKDGRQIPSLSKIEIVRFSKLYGGNKRVTALVRPTNTSNSYICDFEDNGDITIRCEFDQILSLDTIQDLIRQHVNPLINVVSEFLAQSGYTLNKFSDFTDDNLEVLSLSLKVGYTIKRPFTMKKMLGCISPIFNVEETDIAKGVKMRYKRVANFSEMDSIEATIVKAIIRGKDEEDVIDQLMTDFNKTEMEARQSLAALVSNLQVVRNTFQNKRLRVKNDPGFPILISRNQQTNSLDITISDLSGIKYVFHVLQFVDSLVRLVEDEESTDISEELVKEVCKGKFEKVVQVVDIVAAPEKAFADNEEMDIVGEDIVFDDEGATDDYLGMLLGDDDDEDDDEEGGNDEGINVASMSGGTGSKSKQADDKVIPDMTGLSLGHPNPFFKRLKERDSALFLTQKDGKYNAYSKICQWSMRRQPVILTDEEKAKIDKDHAGSYDHAIKYGSSPDKQFWYICPRYWSLSRNVSLTEEQAKSGKFGNIIKNKKADVVPPGQDIFEFDHRKGDGEYEQFSPGFVEPESHPDGLCLPCCFKNWDAPKNRQMRERCLVKDVDGKSEAEKGKAAPASVRQEADNYLMGPDKFPLDQGRWGVLVPLLQGFMGYDNKSCFVSMSNPVLKPKTKCVVRQGVEPSRNQSFLAAIASAYAVYNKNKVPSIEEMKKTIIDSIDLQRYVGLQNGTLVDTFYDPMYEIDTTNLLKDKWYVKQTSVEAGKTLAIKVAKSFEGFKSFLLDPFGVIDYTYLWDVVSQQNQSLFKEGLNLIVLQAPQKDVTGDIELLCPTSAYSDVSFVDTKPTLVLFKLGSYYEPIFEVQDLGKEYELTRLFSLNSDGLMEPIKKVLMLARQVMGKMCSPLPSQPVVYKFASNRPANVINDALKLVNMKAVGQVINSSGQTIALKVAVKKGTKSVHMYVPTQASASLPKVSTIELDDVDFWLDYRQTVDILTMLANKTNGVILSKPRMRVVEGGMTVGILTETNQVVMLANPVLVTDDSLPELDDDLTVKNDIVSQSEDEGDREREEYVARIKAETHFYNLFRNMIRSQLSQFDNRTIRSSIEERIHLPYLTYLDKLKQTEKDLRTLGEKLFKWKESITIEDIAGTRLTETSCVTLSKSDCEKRPLCSFSKKDCLTIMPKLNLLTGANNEEQYFVRMADELIRYSRIRTFVFQPKSFLSFGKVGYDLNEDEVIITQSILQSDYLDTLELMPRSQFVKNNTYQTAEPIVSVAYDNDYIVGSEPEVEVVVKKSVYDKAVQKVNKRIWGKWQSFFPTGSSELMFEPTSPESTFDIFMVTLTSLKPELRNTSLFDVKQVLISRYENVIGSLSRIVSMWKSEGKRELASSLKDSKSIESVIVLPTYYLTPVDMVLLAEFYELPIMLYSATTLAMNDNAMLKTIESDAYVYIKVPALHAEELPVYRLVVSKKGILIATNELSEDGRIVVEDSKPFDIESEFMVEVRVQKRRVRVVKPAKSFDSKEQSDVRANPIVTKPKIIKKKKRLVIAEAEAEAKS